MHIQSKLTVQDKTCRMCGLDDVWFSTSFFTLYLSLGSGTYFLPSPCSCSACSPRAATPACYAYRYCLFLPGRQLLKQWVSGLWCPSGKEWCVHLCAKAGGHTVELVAQLWGSRIIDIRFEHSMEYLKFVSWRGGGTIITTCRRQRNQSRPGT